MKVNSGRQAALLNSIESKVFKRHPLSKRHILFYSNGLAIKHGLPDIRPIEVNNADCRPF